MFSRLAGRNVKRQLGNYLIYFITVSLTVALMFAVNNVIFSKQMMGNAENMSTLTPGLIALTVFVAVIVAFILGYATSFMLKLRKREFGTYLTLGMTRRNILSIFIMETMFMCVVALGVGIVLGLFIYQGMMAIMTNMMEIEIAFASYSLKGLILTVALVCGMFIFSAFTSAIYLRKVKIYDLIHGARKVEKSVKHPVFWFIIMLLALVTIIVSMVAFLDSAEKVVASESNGMGIFVSMVVIAIAIIIMHVALARSVVNLMLKNKKLCSMGTNTFTLRQLSGRLNSNSVMAGMLAFLLAFAIIGANVSFTQKISEQMTIDTYYPFDVTLMQDYYNYQDRQQSDISAEKGEKIIEGYNDIKDKTEYKIYDTDDNYIYSFTPWKGDGWEGMTDTVITESDFNKIWTALGNKPVDLEGGFKIAAYDKQAKECDFSGAELPLGDETYPYKGTIDAKMFFFTYILAIVPDGAVEGLKPAADCIAYDLDKDKYDAVSMRKDLSYTIEEDLDGSGAMVNVERCNYYIKEFTRMDRNSFSAIFVIGAIYIAIVFIFMAMAMLALKTLSGLSEDRQRYRVLFRLGVSEHEQSKTLFKQIFSFFLLPFAVPVLMSFPTSYICVSMIKLGGVEEGLGVIYMISTIITAAMIIIYALYFMATYLIAKRNVIQRES